MSEARRTKLGDVIFSSIDDNDFLNVLYDNMLYNYAILKLHLEGYQQPRQVDIQAALRFADLLSKSTHPTKSDDHKMWAQAIITLLLELYPGNEDVAYYAGSVLSSIGNFRGSEIVRTVYNSTYEEATLQGKAFATFISDYLSVPSEQEKKFFIPQKQIFDQMGSEALSYSAPTSMGKSYIMEVFIKDKIRRGEKFNFARIVPTKALINEVREDTLRGLDKLLEEMNYSVVTAASDYSLDEDHNYILVMTPERLLYLLINRPEFRIDYIFIDEAHKMTGRNSRGPFYYKIVDMLAQRTPMPHFIFASPNIPNPEVYLKLVTEAQEGADNAISSTFSPVTQFKFLISQETKSIRIFNDHTQDSIFVCKYGNPDMSAVRLMRIMAGFDVDKPLEEKRRNIAYFSGKDPAIHAARQYAEGLPEIDDKELRDLADDIKAQVHGDYYLAKLIRKGVAYHIGYLPSSIRLRIEKLFKGGKITAMFCTSTLIEGVNLPADNLFITNYRSGRPKMTSVEFRNLIGRVGRIKFNLYGNVFFISDGKHVTEKEFVRYLQEPIPDQKLSIVEELKPKLKKHVAETLLSGSARIEPYVTPGGTLQPDEEYVMMRKFGLILLQDIMDDRNSLVRREFAEFLPPDGEAIIRSKFAGQKNFIDHDINISADQSRKLAAAIHAGAHYPKPQNGRFTHAVVLGFLEELSRIFDWDRYESQTLGKRNGAGEHAKLSWYAVILAQWMEGHGLSYIMRQAIKYMQDNPRKFWLNDYTPSVYEDTPEHRNVVFADTLEVIENIILFSISNYFLRFSNMYVSIHGENSLDENNWYEFVEYGTTNDITVFLQRNGFSRESANYIKDHPEYIVRTETGLKLRRSLLECKNNDARNEAELILLNRPELFEKEDGHKEDK